MIKIVRLFSNRLAFWLLVRKWEREHCRRLYSFSEILPAGRKAGFTAIELREQYVGRRMRAGKRAKMRSVERAVDSHLTVYLHLVGGDYDH